MSQSTMKKENRAPHFEARRIAVVGYGPAGREHALGLRAAGYEVAVGLRLGGMSWVRARADGFAAAPARMAVVGADTIVVLVPDDEQAALYADAIEPSVAAGALVVFGRAVALETGAFEPRGVDAVLVTGSREAGCRVAVHHDATGRALERATAYARAAFGPGVRVGTTTVVAEAEGEVAALAERAGGVDAFLASVDDAAGRARESHAPEEGKIAFYERLGDLARRPRSERGSSTSLSGRRRGAA